jgi:hypothetical protein
MSWIGHRDREVEKQRRGVVGRKFADKRKYGVASKSSQAEEKESAVVECIAGRIMRAG